MNAAQRRLVFWSLVVAALVMHFSHLSWAIGDPSLPLVPVKLGWNVTVPEGIADPVGWRKVHPYTPAEWLGLNRSPYSDAPYLYGFWFPLLMLTAAQFIRLGQRPSSTNIDSPRPTGASGSPDSDRIEKKSRT